MSPTIPRRWWMCAAGLAALLAGCGPIAGRSRGAAAPAACGIGLSTDANPHQAALVAARQAVAALGPRRLRCALVFENFPPENRALILAGVTSQVPREEVFGCSASGVFTSLGAPSAPAVAVLALGGEDLSVARAVTALGKDDRGLAGEMIARALPKDRAPGLVLLLADGDLAALKELVAGIKGVRGSAEPIVGCTAGGDRPFALFQGRRMEATAAAVAFSGPFAAAVASRSAGSERAHTQEGVVATARQAAQAVVAELGGPPTFVLAFSSETRRKALTEPSRALASAGPGAEAAALAEVFGKEVPLLGLYGPVQVGAPRTGMPALAVEHHIVLCGVRWRGPE